MLNLRPTSITTALINKVISQLICPRPFYQALADTYLARNESQIMSAKSK